MNNFSIEVVVADDHPAVLTGIEHELSSVVAIALKGTAHNSTELIAILEKVSCDVLVSDFAMPGGQYNDGIALFSFIRRHFPMTKLVVYTMLDNIGVLRSLFSQGISCVVSKSDAVSHLTPAIYAAHTGGTYYSPTVSNARGAINQDLPVGASLKTLTPREAEVVRLYASGLTISAIAELLKRSSKTISTQKAMAMKKLGIQTDINLLRYAIENGFVVSAQISSVQNFAINEEDGASLVKKN